MTWDITKIGEDRYHVTSRDVIDEEVDGSQLMGMLASRGLSTAEINNVVLFSLDQMDIGYKTSITFKIPA
jgi:hypothetical protein